jgi:hypothetical protein
MGVRGPFLIGPAAQAISVTGWAEAKRIRNTGTNPVYLSDSCPNAVDDGDILGSGSTLDWDPDQALWAVSAAGSSLTVSDNIGALFDASAISSQLIGQGLPAAIASSIYAQGVAAVEKLTPLQINQATVIASGASADLMAITDVSGQQSLIFSVGMTNATSQRTMKMIHFDWYSDALGTAFFGTTYITVPVFGGAAWAKVQCRGAFVRIRCNVGEVTTTSTTVTSTCYGSVVPITHDRIRVQTPWATTGIIAPYDGLCGIVSYTASVPASTITQIDFSVWQGECDFSWFFGGALAYSVSIFLEDAGTPLYQFNGPAGLAKSGVFRISLPAAACQVEVSTGAEGASKLFAVSLVMLGAQGF